MISVIIGAEKHGKIVGSDPPMSKLPLLSICTSPPVTMEVFTKK